MPLKGLKPIVPLIGKEAEDLMKKTLAEQKANGVEVKPLSVVVSGDVLEVSSEKVPPSVTAKPRIQYIKPMNFNVTETQDGKLQAAINGAQLITVDKPLTEFECKNLVALVKNSDEAKELIQKYPREKAIIEPLLLKYMLVYQFVDESLRTDPIWVKSILDSAKGFGMMTTEPIQFGNEHIKSNAEIVKKAVEKNGFALEHAADNLKDDEDLARLAINHVPQVFASLSKRLRSTPEIIQLAIDKSEAEGIDLAFIVRSLPTTTKQYKTRIKEFLMKDPTLIEHMPDKLKEDRVIAQLLIKIDIQATNFMSPKIRKEIGEKLKELGTTFPKEVSDFRNAFFTATSKNNKAWYEDSLKRWNKFCAEHVTLNK